MSSIFSNSKVPNPFFVLPFDHRAGFAHGVLGYDMSAMTDEQRQHVSSLKRIVWNAVVKSISLGVPKENLGALVDEQFGADIIADAKKAGIAMSVCSEKSGQETFEFEFGDAWREAIERTDADIVKILVRWHPGHVTNPEQQLRDLKTLSDYCIENGRPLMFELLVPPVTKDADKVAYAKEWPGLAAAAVREIGAGGVRPAIWKIEGHSERDGFAQVVEACREVTPDGGIIVLGRNETLDTVKSWLTAGQGLPGVIGFAVGRTVFLDPLLSHAKGEISADEAADQIAHRFVDLVSFWSSNEKAVH